MLINTHPVVLLKFLSYSFTPGNNEPERRANNPHLSPWSRPALMIFYLRLYAMIFDKQSVPCHPQTPSHLYADSTLTSLLFIPEILLILHTLVVDEAVVLSGDFLSGSEACARLGLVDSRHSGSGGCWLWVLFLRNGIAGIDPVEVHIYWLCEV